MTDIPGQPSNSQEYAQDPALPSYIKLSSRGNLKNTDINQFLCCCYYLLFLNKIRNACISLKVTRFKTTGNYD